MGLVKLKHGPGQQYTVISQSLIRSITNGDWETLIRPFMLWLTMCICFIDKANESKKTENTELLKQNLQWKCRLLSTGKVCCFDIIITWQHSSCHN